MDQALRPRHGVTVQGQMALWHLIGESDPLFEMGTGRRVDFLVQYGIPGITAATQLLAALTLMFMYSVPLALVFVAPAPLYALLIYLSRHRLQPIVNQLKEAQGQYQSHQIDAIKGIETVKALSAEGKLRELILQQFHGLSRQQFRANLTSMYYNGAVSAAGFISIILFLSVGAYQVIDGQLSIGAPSASNFLVALANGPIKDLLKMWDAYQAVAVQLNRLDDSFEQEPEQGSDHSRLVPVRSLEGAIRVRQLVFQYGGVESPKILDDITFDAPAGTLVAIVVRIPETVSAPFVLAPSRGTDPVRALRRGVMQQVDVVEGQNVA
jgi:ATP-binding cassette subfamily B protein